MHDAAWEHAPAKVNLALHVTGKRPDGYHLLDTLVVFTEFGDRLSFQRASVDSLEIVGPYAADLDADGSNLVLKARDALKSAASNTGGTFPVAIRLEKNLPVASGVGGGSSDAAATLRALNGLWNAGLDARRLAEIGAPLGADVPMCLQARPLLARGIGENIEIIEAMTQLAVVLVNPGLGVSTTQVFKGLAAVNNTSLPPLPQPLTFNALIEWLKGSRNDLQGAALKIAPPIGEVLAELESEGASFARMSGSGATCFGIFDAHERARQAFINITRNRPDWFVVATSTLR